MIRPGRKQTNWQPHGYQGFGFFIHGLWSGSPPDTRGRSPVRKSRTPGSVRGVSGNGYPYREDYTYSVACGVIGGKMQDYFLESLKLQRIDFFLKLVAASECSDEEKGLALQWVSELTDELMAKIRTHEYNRSMDVIS